MDDMDELKMTDKEYPVSLTRRELISVTSAILLTQLLLMEEAKKHADDNHYLGLHSAFPKIMEVVTQANDEAKGVIQ
jgi:hypothetical protein